MPDLDYNRESLAAPRSKAPTFLQSNFYFLENLSLCLIKG